MHMYHDKLVCTITFIMLAIIVAIYFIIITQEPTLRYPREALLQALHLHRNLFKRSPRAALLHAIHTRRDLLRLSWCISA